MTAPSRSDGFSSRVAVLFGTQIFGAAVGIITGILLARLLGPAGKGDYYLVVLLPATIVVMLQLGLPQAFGFYSARSQTRGMVLNAVALAAILSTIGLAASAVLMPWMRETFLRGPDLDQLVLGLCVLPLSLSATFTTGIVVGRQAVRWNLAATIGHSISSLALVASLVGFLALGVNGAIVAFLVTTAVQSLIYLIGARTVTRAVASTERVGYRDLLRFGTRLYPGTLTSFFSQRLDVLLLAWLLVDASTALGYYSMAVTMAEMVFFFPYAVSRLFFPHVAGSTRENADRQVPTVSRVTLLVTAGAAVFVAPASIALIHFVLPAFRPSIEVLLILLPGVVALSVGKVTGGYVSGLGRTGTTSLVNVGAFIANLVLNLLLIPVYGIVGAAIASLISYTAMSIVFTVVAARLAGTSFRRFWVPGPSDVRFAITTGKALGRRMFRRSVAGT